MSIKIDEIAYFLDVEMTFLVATSLLWDITEFTRFFLQREEVGVSCGSYDFDYRSLMKLVSASSLQDC